MRSSSRPTRRPRVCVKVSQIVACCPKCGDFDFRTADDARRRNAYQCSACKTVVSRTELIAQIAEKLIEEGVLRAG